MCLLENIRVHAWFTCSILKGLTSPIPISADHQIESCELATSKQESHVQRGSEEHHCLIWRLCHCPHHVFESWLLFYVHSRHGCVCVTGRQVGSGRQLCGSSLKVFTTVRDSRNQRDVLQIPSASRPRISNLPKAPLALPKWR